MYRTMTFDWVEIRRERACVVAGRFHGNCQDYDKRRILAYHRPDRSVDHLYSLNYHYMPH